ncbi:MAG: hypothetical protein IPP47_27225 [Bryobacterales bacterium]|nr:hypothetical protein [Bryobacterales bacterium]
MKNCQFCQLRRPAEEELCQICGAVEFDPSVEGPPADFGLRLIGENRLAAAYEYLEGLVARGEETPEHCHRLAWLAYAFGDLRAVEIWSHETLRLDAGWIEAHVLLGLVLQRSGRWAEAAEEYQAGLRRPATPQRRARLEALLERARTNIPEY